MSPKIIFLIGRPGCGKGTQLDFLIEKSSFSYIKTGQELRKKSEEEDFLGNKIKETLLKGKLMPTPVVFLIWMPLLIDFHKKGVKGILFDGNPRKLYEAKMLEEVFDMFDWNEVKACHIKISEEESYKRLAKRGRSDDSQKEIEERLNWFKEEVEPVIQYFKDKGNLVEVDGEQSIDGVKEEIEKKLGNFLNE